MAASPATPTTDLVLATTPTGSTPDGSPGTPGAGRFTYRGRMIIGVVIVTAPVIILLVAVLTWISYEAASDAVRLTSVQRAEAAASNVDLWLHERELDLDALAVLLSDDLVADRLCRSLRDADVVGRWGGEEFVALLSGADDRGAVLGCERVLAAVAQPLGLEEGPTSVTISIGLAVTSTGETPVTDLLRSADRALYRAKALGRDRVVVADDL